MRCNAIILSNGLIHQLIKTVGADKVETLLELGVKTTTETVFFLGIAVCMIARILAQVIENLCELKHTAVSLRKHLEFI
jgi:hypothetical protein